MSASLWTIHQTLQDLEDLRAEIIADNGATMNYEEALAAVDRSIREWLEERSPAKVAGYVARILERKNTIAACKAERARIKAIEDAAQADLDRLEGTALAVMQRFDVTELKATPGGGLRRQLAGGKQMLETSEFLPVGLTKVSVTMTGDCYLWLGEAICKLSLSGPVHPLINLAMQNAKDEPDNDRIREELTRKIQCPECDGDGKCDPEEYPNAGGKCWRCKGTGESTPIIPGARLLERSEILKVI